MLNSVSRNKATWTGIHVEPAQTQVQAKPAASGCSRRQEVDRVDPSWNPVPQLGFWESIHSYDWGWGADRWTYPVGTQNGEFLPPCLFVHNQHEPLSSQPFFSSSSFFPSVYSDLSITVKRVAWNEGFGGFDWGRLYRQPGRELFLPAHRDDSTAHAP